MECRDHHQATVKLHGAFRLAGGNRHFTGTTISPGGLLRQCPNRYAIRAGQNLPDKEFRCLRTVIVTAAVYWGLSSHLVCAKHSCTFPAPGRRHLYVIFRFSRLCFAKQSLGPFHCGPASGAPLSREVSGQFAEFLNNPSPVGLRILIPSTCVGLRYGHLSIH